MTLTNNKRVDVLQLKLLTAAWVVKRKCQVGNVTVIYIVKALRRSYAPPSDIKQFASVKKT